MRAYDDDLLFVFDKDWKTNFDQQQAAITHYQLGLFITSLIVFISLIIGTFWLRRYDRKYLKLKKTKLTNSEWVNYVFIIKTDPRTGKYGTYFHASLRGLIFHKLFKPNYCIKETQWRRRDSEHMICSVKKTKIKQRTIFHNDNNCKYLITFLLSFELPFSI